MTRYQLKKKLNRRMPLCFYKKENRVTSFQSFINANINNVITWFTFVTAAFFVKFNNILPRIDWSILIAFLLLGSVNAFSNSQQHQKENNSISGYTIESVFKIYNGKNETIRIVPFAEIKEVVVKELKNGNHTISFYNKEKSNVFGNFYRTKFLEFIDIPIKDSELRFLRKKINQNINSEYS